MIKNVPLIGIFVNDQQAALDFYTHKLGLEKVQDEPYGESARWITVSPAGMSIRIVLKQAEKEHEKAMVARSDGAPILTLGTDDVRARYERLQERGVRFLGDPTATRGAWEHCSWTRTVARSSCNRIWMNARNNCLAAQPRLIFKAETREPGAPRTSTSQAGSGERAAREGELGDAVKGDVTFAKTRIESLPTGGSLNSYCERTESAVVTATRCNLTEGEAIMANYDNAQAHQQSPQPSPALKSLGRLVGTWEVSGGAQGKVRCSERTATPSLASGCIRAVAGIGRP